MDSHLRGNDNAHIMNRFIKYIAAPLVIGAIFVAGLDATIVLKFAPTYLPQDKVDAIVVLGAAPNSPAIFNRTITGLRLYEQGKSNTFVLAGGKVAKEDEPEARNMYRIVLNNAIVTPGNILLEDQSHNTYENIYNTKRLLPEAKSVLVVSDKFHLPRAVTVARFAGFEEVYWSSPRESYYRSAELRWYYFREMVAMLYYIPRLVF